VTCRRIGVVLHPARDVDMPLQALREWTARHGVDVVQLPVPRQRREVAEAGQAGNSDLVVSIGGDGTTLAAIRIGALADRPVLGVACGSLGALTTVVAGALPTALDRFSQGDWSPRRLPALQIVRGGGAGLLAFSDIVVVRSAEGQVRTIAHVDGTLFGRIAGDGCIVSTAIGSSAYALAAGGPLLAPGSDGFLFTPLPTHGGFCPPVVVGADSELKLELSAGHGGARLEVDGQVEDARVGPLTITLRPDVATLVSFTGQEPLLTGLRRRRIIMDSPRILAEDERA
jgi:NAD+ kinase